MNKLKKINDLKVIVEKERKKGRKIVFANGCFDILHVGHIRYLKEAKELGDMLIVAINSDSSAKKLKGNGRPVTPENERAEIVAAIEYVDYVTIFNEPDVSSLLLTLKPDTMQRGQITLKIVSRRLILLGHTVEGWQLQGTKKRGHLRR